MIKFTISASCLLGAGPMDRRRQQEERLSETVKKKKRSAAAAKPATKAPAKASGKAPVKAKKKPEHAFPRVRILIGDGMVLGPGKVDLLEAIGRTGSISAAGRALGMSYRR